MGMPFPLVETKRFALISPSRAVLMSEYWCEWRSRFLAAWVRGGPRAEEFFRARKVGSDGFRRLRFRVQ